MASSHRAPKQWSLASDASVTEYESWKNNLVYSLSLDPMSLPFLKSDVSWLKQSKANPKCGFVDDGEDIAAANRRTADQKVYALELMLGQIANFSPINRSTIVKSSTSLAYVWKAIRQHLGLQATGARVLELADMCLKPGERYEDLYQRLLAFIDDNLLKADSDLTHNGETINEDEELSPSLENFVVVYWLRLIHKDLPQLVKQRYGTELRTKTLVSIKPEISVALDSLLEEIHNNDSAKAFRLAVSHKKFQSSSSQNYRYSKPKTTNSTKECALCKQAGRHYTGHFLSECKFLPESDRKYVTRARLTNAESDAENYEDETTSLCGRVVEPPPLPVARRVPVLASPYLDVFIKHHQVRVTIDCGATTNYIRHDVALRVGASIRKNSQKAIQADGKSTLPIMGETTINLNIEHHQLILEALVVRNLDEDILGGTLFMAANDVWVRPKDNLIGIGNSTYDYKDNSQKPLANV